LAFTKQGGTEFAHMSTTANLRLAVKYAVLDSEAHAERSEHDCRYLLLRLRTESASARGADISFASAFPKQSEFLYPPLTFLRPVGRPVFVRVGRAQLTVIDVDARNYTGNDGEDGELQV